MSLFVEGAGVVVQACTLVIGLPALAIALAARRGAPIAVSATVVGTALVMWAKAAGHWTLEYRGWRSALLAVAILATFGALHRFPSTRWVTAGAGAASGVIAGWLWQPCVGTHLGDILNNAGGSAANQAGAAIRMTVYTTGALLPAVLLAALPVAFPRTAPALTHRRAELVGLAFGGVYAIAMLSGQYDDLIGQLSRWSSA